MLEFYVVGYYLSKEIKRIKKRSKKSKESTQNILFHGMEGDAEAQPQSREVGATA